MLVKTLPLRQVLTFYFKQILVLGSLAFGMWLFESWMRTGELWQGNWHALWVLTVVFVGVQLITITTPLLILFKKLQKLPLFYIAGLISGPIGVVLFIWAFTYQPFDLYGYLIWPQSEHIIGASLGLGFAHNLRRFLLLQRTPPANDHLPLYNRDTY
ncbi:MAG: hypothetical protein RLZZ422_1423 [Pseudomonadota bacterium]|jgi:hypothetical protein